MHNKKINKILILSLFSISLLIIATFIQTDFCNNTTTNDENIEKLAITIKKINPDIVQIYSIARIPAQHFVYSIDEGRKRKIIKIIKEIINNFK